MSGRLRLALLVGATVTTGVALVLRALGACDDVHADYDPRPMDDVGEPTNERPSSRAHGYLPTESAVASGRLGVA